MRSRQLTEDEIAQRLRPHVPAVLKRDGNRPSVLSGSERRTTGTGGASEEAKAATRSCGTLAVKVAHHR
ncbi:hypothetical protein [Streptomyces klenkii]|uniref:hypothetical protein n=1 Tax=Streptomyces klenkii TaxID=1420899 RepID=UPI003F4B9C55